MRKLSWILALLALAYVLVESGAVDRMAGDPTGPSSSAVTGSGSLAGSGSTSGSAAASGSNAGSAALLADAFENRRSNFQVEGGGEVLRVLPDDIDGDRHQRFILRLSSGQTVLIAHNIDLAPRVQGLEEGGSVEFFGEYEWNDQGGVIHWTHRDPRGQHEAGWLRYRGRTYQ